MESTRTKNDKVFLVYLVYELSPLFSFGIPHLLGHFTMEADFGMLIVTDTC